MGQAGKSANAQAAQLVAGERQLQQARLRTEGAWLQGAQAVVVQVESTQGGEGCQGARLQARDAVVLQEQRLCQKEGGRAFTPLRGSLFSLGRPIHPPGGSHTIPACRGHPWPAAPVGAHLRPGRDSGRDQAQPQGAALHRGAVAAAGRRAGGSARRETRQ